MSRNADPIKYMTMGEPGDMTGIAVDVPSRVYGRLLKSIGLREAANSLYLSNDVLSVELSRTRARLGFNNSAFNNSRRQLFARHAATLITGVDLISKLEGAKSPILSVRLSSKPDDCEILPTAFTILRPDRYVSRDETVRIAALQAMGNTARDIGYMPPGVKFSERQDVRVQANDNRITMIADVGEGCGLYTKDVNMDGLSHIRLIERRVTQPEQQIILFAGLVGMLQAAELE